MILGMLSIVTLIRHGFNYGFGPALHLVLEYYEKIMGVLFGWAEPYITARLAALRDLMGWELVLYPHWKHIFLLMMIYFSARLRSAWSVGERLIAPFMWAFGFVLASV